MTKHVINHNGEWAIKNAQATRITKVFKTQKAAIKYAFGLKNTTSVLVQDKNGEMQKVSKKEVLGLTTPQKKSTKPIATRQTTVKKAPKKPELTKKAARQKVKNERKKMKLKRKAAKAKRRQQKKQRKQKAQQAKN